MKSNSEYLFAPQDGHASKRAAAIAKKHGAELVNYVDENGVKRHWYSTKNTGSGPEVAEAVISAIAAAKVKL